MILNICLSKWKPEIFYIYRTITSLSCTNTRKIYSEFGLFLKLNSPCWIHSRSPLVWSYSLFVSQYPRDFVKLTFRDFPSKPNDNSRISRRADSVDRCQRPRASYIEATSSKRSHRGRSAEKKNTTLRWVQKMLNWGKDTGLYAEYLICFLTLWCNWHKGFERERAWRVSGLS